MQPDPTPDLDELERLEKAATPGPWRRQTHHRHLDGPGSRMLVPVVRAPWPDLPHGTITVARCGNGNCSYATPRSQEIRDREEGNAALIAAARNALPWLLRAARERDELRARAEKAEDRAKELEGLRAAFAKLEGR